MVIFLKFCVTKIRFVVEGDIFFDEPPPLDEPKGPFSRGRGLFDDDDDDDISITKPPNESPKLSKSKGLFDEESDEDIFSKTKPEKQPLFSEEPPALDEKKVHLNFFFQLKNVTFYCINL